MKPVKLFAEFIRPPRTLLALPLVGQVQTLPLLLSGGLALLASVVGQALGGFLLWAIFGLGTFVGVLLVLNQERENAATADRALALLSYGWLRVMRPDALSFRPQDGVPLTTAHQAVMTQDQAGHGQFIHWQGGPQ